MKYTVEIPEYLSIGEYQKLSSLDHLTDLEKTMEIVHTVTTIDKDTLAKWTPNQLASIGESVLDLMDFDNATFYPIIEFNDVLYGYRPISKMTLGEYVDLERLCKDASSNLHEITALLYRPIIKDKTNSLKFQMKNGYKIAKGTAENLFKYYNIEDYNSDDRGVNAERMLTFPVSLALGGMSFFFRSRDKVIEQYKQLFETDGETDDNEGDGPTFGSHWSWFGTVYSLSKTNILSITGDKSIFELNYVFVLNYLAIQMDYNREMEKARKQNTTRLI